MKSIVTPLAFAASALAAPTISHADNTPCTFGTYRCTTPNTGIEVCDIGGRFELVGDCPKGTDCQNLPQNGFTLPFCTNQPMVKARGWGNDHDRDNDKDKDKDRNKDKDNKKDNDKDKDHHKDNDKEDDDHHHHPWRVKARDGRGNHDHDKDNDKDNDHDKDHDKDHDRDHDRDHDKDNDKDHDKDDKDNDNHHPWRVKARDGRGNHDHDKDNDQDKDNDKDRDKDNDRDKDHNKDHDKDNDKDHDKDHNKDHDKDNDNHRPWRVKARDGRGNHNKHDDDGRDHNRRPPSPKPGDKCQTPGKYQCFGNNAIQVCDVLHILELVGNCPPTAHCAYINNIPYCVVNGF